MLHYFTSTAFVVSATINGRHDSYGATTSLVGIFNLPNRAEKAKLDFIVKYNKDSNGRHKLREDNVKITEMKVGEINEIILSKIYE